MPAYSSYIYNDLTFSIMVKYVGDYVYHESEDIILVAYIDVCLTAQVDTSYIIETL